MALVSFEEFGLVHGNLHPDYIFYSSKIDRFCLADFFDTLVMTVTVMGKKGLKKLKCYLSPKIFFLICKTIECRKIQAQLKLKFLYLE